MASDETQSDPPGKQHGVEDSAKKRAHQLFQKSWTRAEAADLEGALELIEGALNLNSQVSTYWATKAQFLLDTGIHLQAQEAARIATETNAKDYHAWALLGEIQGLLGDDREAALSLQESVRLKPDHAI